MTPAEFLQIFHERRSCFAELLRLSREQFELVEHEDYNRLLTLLSGKQRVIGRLEEIGRARPELWPEWRASRDALASVSRNACEQVLSETETILSELMERERVSTEFLAKRRNETQRQLHGIAAGARVNDEYRDALAPATNRFLDLDQ